MEGVLETGDSLPVQLLVDDKVTEIDVERLPEGLTSMVTLKHSYRE
jgi:hypothetical protein